MTRDLVSADLGRVDPGVVRRGCARGFINTEFTGDVAVRRAAKSTASLA